MVLLAILAGACLDSLAAARAIARAEKQWADGLTEAVSSLDRYTRGGAEVDYRRFRDGMSVLLGDRRARLELDNESPDVDRIRTGLLDGRNKAEDIEGMSRLYRRFRHIGAMETAFGLWSESDAPIIELERVGELLHRRIAWQDPEAGDERALTARKAALDIELASIEDRMSTVVDTGARQAEIGIIAILCALPVALLALAFLLSQRAAGRSRKIEGALRASEERFTLAAAGSSDGLWDWNLVTREAYYSPRVHQQLALEKGDLERIDQVFEIVHPDDWRQSRDAMDAHLKSHAPFEMECRLRVRELDYRWFLLRGQAVRDAQGKVVRMAGSISDITDRRRAAAAIERRALQQGLIADFGQFALKNPEVDELLSEAVQVVRQGLDAEFCRLLAVGASDDVLANKGCFGWIKEWTEHGDFDATEETKNRFIIGARQTIIIDDFEREPLLKPSRMLRAHGVRSCAETLICGAHGSYGVLGVYSQTIANYTKETIHFLLGITNTLASAMDRRVADERLTHLAQFDPLTNLPNRNLYLDRLWHTITEARRDHLPVAVMFIDLDRFKMVNDTLGHGAGDELLLQVARRLQNCVRPGDTVGRLGGDEFAVSLAHLAKAEDAGSLALKMKHALSSAFDVFGQSVYVSASIGISIFPTDGSEPDGLLRNADTAMYRAKESGRDSYQFYRAEMNERSLERLKVETQLRGALGRGEFLLHYQPKVKLSTGHISGFEALLRWEHPERGLVQPGDFISILEDTALIIPVTEWVLETVCRQIREWQRMGLDPVPVAVNLSARQFNEKNLDKVLREILEATGVRPGLVEFELTESMLMSDPEDATRTLNKLKAYGVRLSLDDFGTGYSSLAYLKRFPIDSLKIDRTFIRDVTTDAEDATIAAAIISLAHSLNMNVVAEGVETEAQIAFLRRHACDEMQGFYFARPLPASDATRALAERWRLQSAPTAVPARVHGTLQPQLLLAAS
jgi:diguanylate cyclase (GGDEF)-like protein/PAS domain S-box-containing protein